MNGWLGGQSHCRFSALKTRHFMPHKVTSVHFIKTQADNIQRQKFYHMKKVQKKATRINLNDNSASPFVKAAGTRPTHTSSLCGPLTFPQHASSSYRHISCVICLFSPPDAKKEAFVFLWSGWRGCCLSLLRSFEKAVILHEKRAPKATSVTSGVTLTDRVQSKGLTMLLLAAYPTRTDSSFGAESNKAGFSLPRACAEASDRCIGPGYEVR